MLNISRLKKIIELKWPQITLLVIVLTSFIYRIINLNYNSPFNDEAIYIVLGKFGIFQGDWWTYNASAWMAGQPYIYPPITAIAYMFGGIVGSRFLNVLFGVLVIEAIYAFTYESVYGSESKKAIAGLIAAFVIAWSSTGYYISRLATYDLPSIYFFILSFLFLNRATKQNENPGKLYFLSSSLLFLAFMSKVVIALYIPLVVIYSKYKSFKVSAINYEFWKKYFMLPLIVFTMLYVFVNFHTLFTYAKSQVARDRTDTVAILSTYFENTSYVWILWIVASVGMFITKDVRKWFILTSTSLVILAFHILLHRWPTLDKHTFLTIIFLAPIIGIGFSNLIFGSKIARVNSFASLLTLVLIGQYALLSIIKSDTFNYLWADSTQVLSALTKETKNGDKILAEVGAGAILANYDKNYPINTSTFDWFTYQNLEGEKAYKEAIKEGYFDLIELDGGDATAEMVHSNMHNLVLSNVEGSYKRIYNTDGFVIYKRTY